MPLALFSALSLALALIGVSTPLQASALHIGPVPAAALIEGPVPDGTARARALFEAGRYAEAAAAFEAEWDAHRAPRSLFNAAVARERLGHEAAAYAHLRRFLATPELTPAERSAAQQRLTKLIARTVPLQVTLMPAAADARVTLHLADRDDRSALEVDLATFASEVDPGVVEVQVEAGTWRVRGEAPGFRAAEREVKIVYPDPGQVILALEPEAVRVVIAIEPAAAIEAGAKVRVTPKAGGEDEIVDALGSTSLDLAPGWYGVEVTAPGFEAQQAEVEVGDGREVRPVVVMMRPKARAPRSARDVEAPRRDRLGLGLGIASAATGAVGVVLVGVAGGRSREDLRVYKASLDDPSSVGNELVKAQGDRVVENLAIVNAGSALLGGALGGATSSLLSLTTRVRPKHTWLEITGGASLGIAGSIGFALNYSKTNGEFQRVAEESKTGAFPRAPELHQPGTALTAAIAGVGGGLFVGGVAKAIRNRAAPPRTGLALISRGHGALITIVGSF